MIPPPGGEGGAPKGTRVDEPASLVVADSAFAGLSHVAKLGRPILLNPSCPPTPPDVEHAKKHEPFRAQFPPDQRKTETELTTHARLKKPAISQVEVDLTTQRPL